MLCINRLLLLFYLSCLWCFTNEVCNEFGLTHFYRCWYTSCTFLPLMTTPIYGHSCFTFLPLKPTMPYLILFSILMHKKTILVHQCIEFRTPFLLAAPQILTWNSFDSITHWFCAILIFGLCCNFINNIWARLLQILLNMHFPDIEKTVFSIIFWCQYSIKLIPKKANYLKR